MTTDLHSKVRPQVEMIHSCAKDVKRAIALAKATSDRKEEEFQEQERKLAAKHREQWSIFASRSRKEHERARELQIQRDEDLLSTFHGLFYQFTLTSTGEKKIKLLDSLSTYKHQTTFHQTRKKRHVNTATWLLSTPEFAEWKNSETTSVFILTGKRKFTVLLSKPY